MRELATVETVKALRPIEGADKIECATVRGWDVVVKKGEFEVGDYCVFFEIDSVLPNVPQFSFLSGLYSKRIDGMRLKTVRMRGQVSQGLALPLRAFPELEQEWMEKTLDPVVDYNVTEKLGIRLYEPVEVAGGDGVSKADFPHFIPKTDAERVQNLTPAQVLLALDENAKSIKRLGEEHVFALTEKLDGKSATFYIARDEDGGNEVFGLCSRNRELLPLEEGQEPASDFHRVEARYNIRKHLRELCRRWDTSLAVQGEIVGPGVQKNRYKQSKLKFFIYSVYDIDAQVYLPLTSKDGRNTIEVAAWLGAPHVPVLNDHYVACTGTEGIADAAEHALIFGLSKPKGLLHLWLEQGMEVFRNFSLSKKYSDLEGAEENKKLPWEGVVIRPNVPVHRLFGRALIMKYINEEYLIKHEE